jgi:chromosome segregation ATPase
LDDFQNLYQLAPEASPMAPGPSSQAHNTRRSTKEKRGSLAVLEQSPNTNHNTNTNNNNNNNSSLVPQEGQHTVESLTEDLDAIRKEAQEAEAQLAHNEEEFKSVEAVLRAELDALKNKKNEEDAGRQRIRAETKSLEEARRTAEALRTRTEKALKAKECEIEKMQEDISQWEKEMITALTKVEKLKNSTQESLDNAAATEEELSVKIRESQKEIFELEEEIRSLVAIMKQLESQKQQKKIEEDAEAKRVQEDVEKDCRWRERQRDLEMRYVTTYNAFQAVSSSFVFIMHKVQLLIMIYRLRLSF